MSLRGEMGKSAVDQTLSNFGGIDAGVTLNPSVQEGVESADLLLTIGCVKSDVNTVDLIDCYGQLPHEHRSQG